MGRSPVDRVTVAASDSTIARAEIIAVGTEMLAADRTDTNSLYLTGRLNELGIEVAAKAVVGDDLALVATLVGEARRRSDLVVLTGGLGPTDDDLTRAGVATALGRDLVEDEATIERIRQRFERRGMRMPDINRRQGQVVVGAEVLENPVGTAPGQWIDDGSGVVVLLPGPPRELQPMFEAAVRPRLLARVGPNRIFKRTVRIVGRTESHAEERLRPLYAAWSDRHPPVLATILAARGQIELQLSSRGADEASAESSLERAVGDVVAAFGADVCSTDGSRLEEVVGGLLRGCGLRIALAESCTGGLVAARLTDVPGSSDYLDRATVAYSNRAKIEALGVAAELIAEHGAVSEPVAVAMAEGARRKAGVEVGVGVTGVAGPGGGTEAKPVGTVAIAVAGPGERVAVRTLLLPGTRAHVRTFSTTAALDMVRRAILER